MKKNSIFLIISAIILSAAVVFTPVSSNLLPQTAITAEAASKYPLNYKSKQLIKGESFSLKANSSKKVTYKSSKPSVASVTSNGVVKGKKAGTAVITVRIGKKKYTCKITVKDTVDLILFSGQSNMTGRGTASLAPTLIDGAGYECKTVTDVNKLTPIAEPFGLGQDSGSMRDGDLRTGSMVTAFVNEYYKRTKVPVVGVSATVVGSGRVSWSTTHYKEAAKRLNKAQKALKKKGIKIRHIYMVYMQGENDGFAGSSTTEYKNSLKLLYQNMKKRTDVEACMIIRIGSYIPQPSLYNHVIKAQTQLCKTDEDFVLISAKAAGFTASYYQQDGLHLTQKALNVLGKDAGKYASIYANTGIEPNMKDPKYNNTYKPNATKSKETTKENTKDTTKEATESAKSNPDLSVSVNSGVYLY